MKLKRLRNYEETIRKKINIDWTDMISGSAVKNYFLNDPLLDWLSYYNIKKLSDKPVVKEIKGNNSNYFPKFIMKQGNLYENNIYEYLKKNYDTIKIADSYLNRSEQLFNETVDCIKEGVPIIYQGVLHNYDNQTYGSPDLMIRSDYINDIFGYNVIDENDLQIKSTKLDLPYYYIIIDIKYSSINFNSSGKYILNSGFIPAYKGQILIYNLCLQNILGINFHKAFILGKDFQFGKSKLGLIDYKNSKIDSIYYNKLNEALDWIRLMRREGHNWFLLPKPSRTELYPNMNNYKDDPHHELKVELSTKIKEITSLWNVKINNRIKAHNQNIYAWDHCNSTILGIKGKMALTIDRIIETNKSKKITISPPTINTNLYNDNDTMEFYLDYETITTNLDVNNNNKYNNFIFMIGLGYENKNKWKFTSFISESINDEKNMFIKFWEFIDNILIVNNKSKAIFIHWSHAEPNLYKTKINKYNLSEKHFMDLYKIFTSESISIKGALNYSLKTIANALYDNNLISTNWNNSKCSNGLNAMMIAMKLYNKNIKITNRNNEIKKIIKYNEIDCKVLYEILKFLRLNYNHK